MEHKKLNWKRLLSTKSTRRVREGTTKTAETSSASAGKEKNDVRSEFEKDLGKIIFSTPFRRLQDKAQVFPLEPIDSIRNRASHSAEVANVARGIALGITKKLADQHLEEIDPELSQSIVTIANSCGLLHDLGNPPFGHAGEDAIKLWFNQKDKQFWESFGIASETMKRDFTMFDGNAQTLRLVSRLQVLADTNGLNLTSATFGSLIKYTADCNSIDFRDNAPHSLSKLGILQTELPLVNLVREELGTTGCRNPITLMVEAADDIVYAAADMEDAIKKGLISWDDVVKALDDEEQSDKAYTTQQRDTISGLTKEAQSFIDNRTRDYPEEVEKETAYAEYFRTIAIREGVNGVVDAFIEKYTDIMQGNYDGELLKESDAAAVYNALKKRIGAKKIYQSKEAIELEILGINVIHGLMDIFIKAFENQKDSSGETESHDKRIMKNTTMGFNKKILMLYSSNYKLVYYQECEKSDLPEGYLQLRLLTDYICGMTDSFALNLYQKLTHAH